MVLVGSRSELTFLPRGTHLSIDNCRKSVDSFIHSSNDTGVYGNITIQPTIPDNFEGSVSSSDDDSYDESTMYENFIDDMETSSVTLNGNLSSSRTTPHDNETERLKAVKQDIRKDEIKRKKFRKVRLTKLNKETSLDDTTLKHFTNKAAQHEEQTHISVRNAFVTNSIDVPNKLQENNRQNAKDGTIDARHNHPHKHEKSSQLNHCWPGSDFPYNEDVSVIKAYDDNILSKGCELEESKLINSTHSQLSKYHHSADKLTEPVFESTTSNSSFESKSRNVRINARKVKKKQSGSYKCDHCLKEFKEKHKLKEHNTLHTGERPYQCGACGQSFRLKGGLKVHIDNVHSTGKNHTCTVCFKTYNTARSLHKHTKTHTDTRFKCDTCGKSFATFPILRAHIYYKHSDIFGDNTLNLECIVCGKRFSHTSSLYCHLQVHEGTQQYGCDLCGVYFSRKTDLARHRMTHTGERPYKCDKCDYSCIRPGDFNRHKSRHGGQESKHACPYCDKKLVRRIEMKAHISTHESGSGVTYTPFQCRECGECLKSKHSLEKHRIEQYNYRIVCDECGKEFSSSGNRNKHKQRQHSSYAISCKLCSKTFKCNANLQDHLRFIHEKNRT